MKFKVGILNFKRCKEFINTVLVNENYLVDCIKHFKDGLFTTHSESESNKSRPKIHIFPRFTKNDDLINFIIETESGNKSILTNTEHTNFIEMSKFISKIGGLLVSMVKDIGIEQGFLFWRIFT